MRCQGKKPCKFWYDYLQQDTKVIKLLSKQAKAEPHMKPTKDCPEYNIAISVEKMRLTLQFL